MLLTLFDLRLPGERLVSCVMKLFFSEDLSVLSESSSREECVSLMDFDELEVSILFCVKPLLLFCWVSALFMAVLYESLLWRSVLVLLSLPIEL